MADIPAIIEAQELRLMQAWMHRDAGTIRKISSREFTLMIGTNPPEILDRPSFVAAIEHAFRLTGFRLHEAFVRRHGRTAWYTAGAELEFKFGVKAWSGQFLVTDMWRKHRIGGWKLEERSLAPTDPDEARTDAVRRMQMWR